jgi:FkbM family methyltransferase
MISRAFKKLHHYYAALGVLGVLAFVRAKLTGKRPLFATRKAGTLHPVNLRIGSTDVSVFRQVFEERQYDVTLPQAPRVIIDAGANIGLASVFFANKYPEAMIVAIEPERSNFDVLKKNTAGYSRIKSLNAALWKHNGSISLFDSGEGNHAFQTLENPANGKQNGGMVQALTVDSIMKQFGFDQIDVLKIDIEGAEKEVFENCSGWIGHVGVVMAEIHDHLKPGCSKAYKEATADFPQETVLGETIVRLRQ